MLYLDVKVVTSLLLLQAPFFSDEEETYSTPKADALFFPRENPRALVIRPTEQWPSKSEKSSPFKGSSAPIHENGEYYLAINFLMIYNQFNLQSLYCPFAQLTTNYYF